MPERFSTPEWYSRRQGAKEIEEGLEEWRQTPKSKEGGYHPELAEQFDVELAEKPIKRKDVETEAAIFIEKHFKELLALMLSEEQEIDQDAIIRRLRLTNEEIAMLGGQYFIREKDGKKSIYKTDEYNPDGRPTSEITTADFLALAWAKENIRIDTRRDVRGADATIPHRYFLRSQNRYLCSNDFGMCAWDDETNTMLEPNVCNVAPLIRTIKHQFARISENFSIYYYDKFSEQTNLSINEAVRAALEARGVNEQGQLPTGEYLPWEERSQIENQVKTPIIRAAQEKMVAELEQNTRDRELLLTGISSYKVKRQLHFKYEAIARKYGLFSDDALRDYQNFERSSKWLNRLFAEPSEQERQGATIDFVFSEFYNKPIIFEKIDKENVIGEIKDGIREILGLRAAKADPETAELMEQYRFRRGKESPYYYSDATFYDFLKAVGPERAEEILAADDRDVFRQMSGWQLLKKLGFDLRKMEPDKLKKQLAEAYKLIEKKGVWQYLQQREAPKIEAARKRLGKSAEGKTWEEVIGVRACRDLFFEGKRMHWLALQVFLKNPYRAEGEKFYQQWVDWSRYDLSVAEVPQNKLNEYLEQHINLIAALLGQQDTDDYYGKEQAEQQGKQATLGLIIQALARSQDLRGVALARDKQRYLKGVIDGHEGEDLTFAIADWPTELQTAISQAEIEMYYEYANDYVLRDPNGLFRYAEWRATEEGREWQSIFAETPESKSDLDFRLCLAAQTPEIRGWYKEAAEYTGGTVVQNYLLRFNATRGTDGRLANWHDVLFWVPNIRRLEPAEAKSILNSIQTMDDNQEFINFLPRYNKEHDPFLNRGPVSSLRELKKRVFAVESNLDLSGLPPEILEITAAPGFNLGALEELKSRADFHDLAEGKLDCKQPFEPHRRIFAGRPLTEALKEGLGAQKMKIRGTAKDIKGLFYSLKQLIKGRKVGEKQMEVTDLFQNIPVDLEEEVIRLLQEQNVDVGPLVEAQIHAKSDPEGWVCGNYTDCCMPFGDYKNNDYMFNPSTQYFTIKYNGRIVAQSVVIDSRNHLDNSDVVILDNIEVANNYKNLSPLLARVYQIFWAEYTSRPVKVGTGYSDLIPPGGRLEKNVYEPKTHVVYSDARGEQIYDLPKIRGVESLDEAITFANLTERDAELIARLERAIYPKEMTQGKAHIADILRKQRELEVPGAASSFVVRSGKEAVGYFLVLPEESEINPGEYVAHVHDMAILPNYQGKGLARKMMEHVLNIATAYKMSIEAEARASTSYAMIMNERVRQWFESQGFFLTHDEKMDKYLGGEDFYFVRFEYRGVPTQEE